jgi:hypothetical protein
LLFGSSVFLPLGPDFHWSYAITIPPSMTNGVANMQMIAILHWKKADKAIPAKMQITDSMIVAIVSVVRPLRLLISSDKMFVRIPGALSFLSNHETCL